MFGTKQSTTECTALLSHLKGINFALYHCTEGIEERYRLAFQLISWALATPVLFYSGYPFLSSAIRSLRWLTLHMDVVNSDADRRIESYAENFGQQCFSIIRQNLVWAFSYNLIALPLAVSGVLHPIISALLMVTSSLVVVSNSLRLKNL